MKTIDNLSSACLYITVITIQKDYELPLMTSLDYIITVGKSDPTFKFITNNSRKKACVKIMAIKNSVPFKTL